MKPLQKISILSLAVMLMTIINTNGQNIMPEELTRNTLKNQLNYIEERTRIYENYRAVREDMFQKVKMNVIDTLSLSEGRIKDLIIISDKQKRNIDSLTVLLESTKSNLEQITQTKNSIRFFGSEVNKTSYNTILWSVVAGLLAVLAIGFLMFKRNFSVTQNTKKELQDLKNEFEEYRKTTRIAREKMSMDHFNEIKKLKAKG